MWIRPQVLAREGGRVRLEPLRQEHAPGLFAALDFDEVWRLRPDPRVPNVEAMEPWVAKRVVESATGGRQVYVMVIEATGEIAGTTGYLEVQPENRSLEIGATIVTPRWQRTFVNTECKLLLLEHAFEVLGCVRVQFRVDQRNLRSQTAVERIGAVREGVLRKSKICHDGYTRDTVSYSIIVDEWPVVKLRLASLLR